MGCLLLIKLDSDGMLALENANSMNKVQVWGQQCHLHPIVIALLHTAQIVASQSNTALSDFMVGAKGQKGQKGSMNSL